MTLATTIYYIWHERNYWIFQNKLRNTESIIRIIIQDIHHTASILLKDRLTSAPVLTLPEGTDGFVVHCDASRVGLGCVLMQNSKVIASRQLNSMRRIIRPMILNWRRFYLH
ncbi:hypothetical protein MTR67_043301 [Solanum verrucosum]|uniref:Reverse transcriptase/retrotransposon-derived protein RNase H-like domain-containing protein n=1 Tax=Solanum verrucosum TaxID=315347 RepID=A0AAF0URQ3_SOLVR|nr:hypothetical protein MTR67_043301 [Solanum verrucosum]